MLYKKSQHVYSIAGRKWTMCVAIRGEVWSLIATRWQQSAW